MHVFVSAQHEDLSVMIFDHIYDELEEDFKKEKLEGKVIKNMINPDPENKYEVGTA